MTPGPAIVADRTSARQRGRQRLLSWGLLLGAASSVQAGPAHQHGVGRLDLAVDGGRVHLLLRLPLDSVLGFERAPRTPAERQQVEALRGRLREGPTLFRLDPAAGCRLDAVELDAPVLDGGAGPEDGHADLEVRQVYHCQAPAQLQQMELRAFASFPRLARLDVQAVLPQGQRKLTLTRTSPTLKLSR